jgi:catechol 2,3-dioxygenase-like lactoylglutathione lyase family enzyme
VAPCRRTNRGCLIGSKFIGWTDNSPRSGSKILPCTKDQLFLHLQSFAGGDLGFFPDQTPLPFPADHRGFQVVQRHPSAADDQRPAEEHSLIDDRTPFEDMCFRRTDRFRGRHRPLITRFGHRLPNDGFELRRFCTGFRDPAGAQLLLRRLCLLGAALTGDRVQPVLRRRTGRLRSVKYTRARAIEDGVLIDLSQFELIQRHWKFPFACTSAVWEVLNAAARVEGIDLERILFDVPLLAQVGIQTGPQGELVQLAIMLGGRLEHLKLHLGPGDTADPVLILMMEKED